MDDQTSQTEDGAIYLPVLVRKAQKEAKDFFEDPAVLTREEWVNDSIFILEKLDDSAEKSWSEITDKAVQTIDGTKRRSNEFEDKRKALKRPSMDEGSGIDAAFSPVQARLALMRKQAEKIITMNSARVRRIQTEEARVRAAKEREELLAKQAEAERVAKEANDPDTIAAAEVDAITAEADLKNAETKADNAPPPVADPIVVQTDEGQSKATISKVIDSVNITNWKAFLQWVVDSIPSDGDLSKTPATLKPNEVELKKLVKILPNVPGVNAVYREQVTVRGTK